ncbi:MAG TPA: NUDIX domain-containing protein [Candidatus Alistipes excrementipullorum]|nr:NUDIX domain-containing protein [Candidatus Alistipes excrementipullorum]
MSPIVVYFLDKSITFLPSGADISGFGTAIDAAEGISRAKVIKILDSHNRAAVLSDDPEQAFKEFGRDFTYVTAAGGVVRDGKGNTLMIYRRGRWDLPKGHWEKGETIEECAMREVEEETGVGGTKIVAPICNTFHAYNVYGKWELKCTHWFLMSGNGDSMTVPQQEEGISSADWLDEERVSEALKTSYPTILTVFAALGKME